MLPRVLSLLFTAYAVLADDTINQDTINELLLQASLPGHLPVTQSSEAVRMMMKPEKYEYCPAGKVLKQIELMLSRLSYQNGGETIYEKTITRQGYDQGQNLVIPMSRIGHLKELLKENKLQRQLRTKVTVQYELPSVEESSCKQTLLQILQLLQEAKPTNIFFRSCDETKNCPKENSIDIKNYGNKNVLTNEIQQVNSYQPYDRPSSTPNPKGLGETNQEFKDLLKEIMASNNNKEDIKINKEIINNNWHGLSTRELVQKFNLSSFFTNPKSFQADINTPEQILNEYLQKSNESANIAEDLTIESQTSEKPETNVENISNELLAVNSNQSDVLPLIQSAIKKGIDSDASKDEKVTFTINSLVPTKDILTDDTVQQGSQINVDFKPDILTDTSQNDTAIKVTTSSAVNTGIDYNKFYNTMLKYQTQNQNPALKMNNLKYPGSETFYINQNLFSNKQKNSNPYTLGSFYQLPYQISSGYNNFYVNDGNQYKQYSGVKIPNNSNVFYTSYIDSKPYLVNSKLINNLKHAGSQFYQPYNITNLQRVVGVTNQAKLNSHDNNGVVELTYMLRQPNPVVYKPVHYVKYQLPYESFTNVKELLSKRPELRADPIKLKHELLAVSKVAEVSPTLKGLEQQKLMELVKNSGSLVNTKVLSINETLLEKQLDTVRNLNSMLAPNEIVNVTYSIIMKTDRSDGLDKFKLESSGTNQNGFETRYVKDFLRADRSFAGEAVAVSTEVPNTVTTQNNETTNSSPV